MKPIRLIVILLVLFFCSSAFGAATCTVDREISNGIITLIFTWKSHTDGAVASGTCDETTTTYLNDVTGTIIGAKFEPDATTPPSDAYDVVLNTPGGADVLFGAGANQTNDDSVTTMWQTPLTADSRFPVIYREDLDLVITNAGDTKYGKIFLFIME